MLHCIESLFPNSQIYSKQNRIKAGIEIIFFSQNCSAPSTSIFRFGINEIRKSVFIRGKVSQRQVLNQDETFYTHLFPMQVSRNYETIIVTFLTYFFCFVKFFISSLARKLALQYYVPDLSEEHYHSDLCMSFQGASSSLTTALYILYEQLYISRL